MKRILVAGFGGAVIALIFSSYSIILVGILAFSWGVGYNLYISDKKVKLFGKLITL